MKAQTLAACLLTALASHQAFGQMQVTLNRNTSQYSSGIGGEFRATAGGTPNLTNSIFMQAYSASTSGFNSGQYYFQTFCIEYNEHFNPGNTYNVTIGSNALYGSQSPTGDPVSIGTAWLYSQFAAGTLIGLTALNVPSPYNYTYGSGRSSTAGQLQNAIWWLENEPSGVADPGNGNVFRNAVLNQFGNAVAAMSDANGAYGVRAMNLGAPGLVQDQLVIVPEPSSWSLVIASVAVCRMFRRRS